MTEEHTISKDATLAVISQLTKEWQISFDFKPTSYSGTRQILYIGSNDPGIYTLPDNEIRFHYNINGAGTNRDFKGLPPLGKWTKLEFKQVKEGGVYFISISMDNKILFKGENSSPVERSNLRVEANGGYTTQPGTIKSLLIQNKNF